MSDNKLYVIGNGFDLHHGIASKFSDFRLFLEEKERELCEKIEEYLCGLEGNWANLEEALSAFDYDTVLDHASDLLVSYAAEDWSDSFHHDYQYEINEIVQALSKKLKGSFVEWLQLISVPTRSQALASLVEIEVEGKFMNFNYTPTLQKVYGVAPDRILHVHGSLNSGANSIVLGHGWAPTDRQSLNAIRPPRKFGSKGFGGQ